MSECHHHEHEAWKAKLSHSFKDLKEADNDRDARLRHNQEAVERILRDVFPPVFARFVKDAEEHGFHAEVSPLPNNRQRLTLEGPTSCTFDFSTEATPDATKVIANRLYGTQENLLRGKKPEHFQESDLGDYLAAQLEEIRPK
jgi:hypothetical protein